MDFEQGELRLKRVNPENTVGTDAWTTNFFEHEQLTFHFGQLMI